MTSVHNPNTCKYCRFIIKSEQLHDKWRAEDRLIGIALRLLIAAIVLGLVVPLLVLLVLLLAAVTGATS